MLNPRRIAFRTLCCLMAIVTGLSPSATLWAQQRRPVVDLSSVLPNSCVVIVANPRQLLTADCMQMLPIEVLSAASIQATGLDPVKAHDLMVMAMPPVMGPPNFVVSANFTEPIQLKESPQFSGHTAPGEINGKAYLKSQHPNMPSLYQANPSNLLLTPDTTLRQLLRDDGATDEEGFFAEHLQEVADDDLAVLVDLQPLQQLIQMGLAQAQQDLPPEAQPFLQAPELIRLVKLRLNFSGKGPCELVAEANSAADADKLEGLVDQAMKMWHDAMTAKANASLASEDPIEQALGRYQTRISNTLQTQFRPTREGNSLVLFRQEVGDGNSTLTSTAVIGVLVALLLPAVQAAREAARRAQSMNNLKQIMLALLNYESALGNYPAHANYDENGKPLLSWRVHILPFIEQGNLYDRFRLDEPWDSEHNRQLIPLMPNVYLDASSGLSPEEGKTSYLGSAGEGAVFNGTEKGTSLRHISDGTSNTIAVLQVDDSRAAIWTQPVDWEVDTNRPLNGLGGLHPGNFQAAFCDGSVHQFSMDIDVETFRKLLTIAGGEVVNY